jgi:hypothetical protein
VIIISGFVQSELALLVWLAIHIHTPDPRDCIEAKKPNMACNDFFIPFLLLLSNKKHNDFVAPGDRELAQQCSPCIFIRGMNVIA